MKRASILGLAALLSLGLASAGPAAAQTADERYTDAMQIVATEPTLAWSVLKPLADGGHAQSMAAVGSMLATGLGVAEDDAAGRDWYRRAAEAGSVSGLRGFGGMLLQGEGGPKDAALGIGLLLVAANAGDESAQMLLSLVREDEDPGDEAVMAARDKWLKARRDE